jgi:hypothetical protein
MRAAAGWRRRGMDRLEGWVARRLFPTGALLLFSLPLVAQVPLNGIGGNLRIINTDMAVLVTQDVRQDLPCTVNPSKPALGFDLRFHTGYEVSIPMHDLAGGENMLTVLFRVTPASQPEDPRYFLQRVRVPAMPESTRGDAVLNGIFDVGEGSYHVDWLMRDRAERVCSFYWDSEAAIPDKDKQMELAIAPGAVERSEYEQFSEEPPVQRASGEPLNIKVLVNFAPQRAESSSLRPMDTVALVTMLRQIAREPQIGKFSLVAFNIHEQRILYRQSNADKIDFPALGEAIRDIQPGVVDLKRLAQKHGETEFLADLVKKELGSGDRPDAVIFAGPKALLDQSVADEELKPFVSDVDFPVFYVNYNLFPQAIPWRDSIGKVVRVFRGTEYTVSRPRDLWFAVSEMVTSIVRSKRGRVAGSSSSQ